ncbi:hypothetical protein D9758_010758 [Tetrapyrgos nigripes]|uniref:Uncharacterized protein n=1 Tax=Tetrapyrgos nigripes TaxID=182062 RepID=A0A8H5FYY2_9AGAR|nr:hypothetical protein D9758_010758 [Tetrapyrgos nigripes]
MPKRIPTPPPPDDEPKYLAVWYPYPLNANMEVKEDYIATARWIAQCIGPNPLYALLYKPSARGMILLEISRAFTDWGNILGEHRWKEVLRRPTHEEHPRVSRIYDSRYKSGRAAQKEGWKRIDVKDSWFNDWSFENNHFAFPYPGTYWCDRPSEDKTAFDVCHNLDTRFKQPPPAVPDPPKPGSQEWLAQRSAPKVSNGAKVGTTMSAATRKLNKSRPPAWNQPITPKASSSKPSGPANAWTTPNKVVKSPHTVLPGDVWANSPQLAKSASQPAKGAWGTGASPAVKSAKAPPAPRQPLSAPVPPGLPLPPGLIRSQGNTSSSSGWEYVAPAVVRDPSPQVDQVTKVMQAVDLAPAPATLEDFDNLFDDPEAEDFVAAPYESTPISYVQYQLPEKSVEVVENLWGDQEEPDLPEEERCSFHGFTCKKGICVERSKIEKEKERRKKAGATNGNSTQKGKGKKGKGGNWRKGGDGDGNQPNGSGSNSENNRSSSRAGTSTQAAAPTLTEDLEDVDPW